MISGARRYGGALGTAAVCLGLVVGQVAMGYREDVVRVAPWYGDRRAAVSLRFDDAFDSHREIAVPMLNRYGMKATFMVNPGRARYRNSQQFWEVELPKMGHRLGNHTMNHKGARTAAEADYEIGETSRRIWRAYPGHSRLNVFASGGGSQRWGGKTWSTADTQYKRLLEKYDLIDLYDGKHGSYGVQRRTKRGEVVGAIKRAIERGAHQPFTFHEIEEFAVKNWVKQLLLGHNLNIDRAQLRNMLDELVEQGDSLWVAPLIDVLKYEEERAGATIDAVNYENGRLRIHVTVRTNPDLYDHRLTLVIPAAAGGPWGAAFQNHEPIDERQVAEQGLLLSISPRTSVISVLPRND